MTGWIAIGVMLLVAFLFGFIVCALAASNSYERGWRDAVRAYDRERGER